MLVAQADTDTAAAEVQALGITGPDIMPVVSTMLNGTSRSETLRKVVPLNTSKSEMDVCRCIPLITLPHQTRLA